MYGPGNQNKKGLKKEQVSFPGSDNNNNNNNNNKCLKRSKCPGKQAKEEKGKKPRQLDKISAMGNFVI